MITSNQAIWRSEIVLVPPPIVAVVRPLIFPLAQEAVVVALE